MINEEVRKMVTKIALPTQRISPKIIPAQRLGESIVTLISLAILGGLYGAAVYFEWKTWLVWLFLGLILLDIVVSIWSIIFEPYFLQKNWRYEVDEEYLQMKHGAIRYVYEVVPMAKIQSVTINQGPILRKYGLYEVRIGTMGTGHEIPGLTEQDAHILRDQIAAYAKIKEVE